MKTLHALAFSLLASLPMPASSAESPSPLAPVPREQPQWWRQQYEQQVEQVKNNSCGVLFLGDSITDYWKREGKQVWEKAFKPYHPCNFGISGDQTTNLIYRITDSGIPAQTEPKLCIVMIGTNNTGHFKGGEAPEKTAMGILGAVHHLRQHQQALSGPLRKAPARHQQGQPALHGKGLCHLGGRRAALHEKILQVAWSVPQGNRQKYCSRTIPAHAPDAFWTEQARPVIP